MGYLRTAPLKPTDGLNGLPTNCHTQADRWLEWATQHQLVRTPHSPTAGCGPPISCDGTLKSEVSMKTLSYVSGSSSHPLIGETIGNCFERSAEKWSEREALVVRQQNVRYTYAE